MLAITEQEPALTAPPYYTPWNARGDRQAKSRIEPVLAVLSGAILSGLGGARSPEMTVEPERQVLASPDSDFARLSYIHGFIAPIEKAIEDDFNEATTISPLQKTEIAKYLTWFSDSSTILKASLSLPRENVVISSEERDTRISKALEELYEFRTPDWDGDGALALADVTIERTGLILKRIPTYFNMPDIAPAADGSVCMEWNSGADFLWVDVEQDGQVRTLKNSEGQRNEKQFDLEKNARALSSYLQANLELMFPLRSETAHFKPVAVSS